MKKKPVKIFIQHDRYDQRFLPCDFSCVTSKKNVYDVDGVARYRR